MRVIFLDVDGVLNCRNRWNAPETFSCKEEENSAVRLDAIACMRLMSLVEQSKAKIVVSSTWRLFYMDELTAALTRLGLPEGTIIGRTRDLEREAAARGDVSYPIPRGREIKAWLDEHPDVGDQFVILDDNDDMHPVKRHLIHTTWADGLLDGHVDAALRLFAYLEARQTEK